MFSKRIISSDAFMDMSASAQMLYFHLSMWADDEGFVNNPKTIQRMCGADSEDMSVLIKNGLVIRFESGIIAIKHWKTHNYIRGDRIKPTYCADEKAQLCVSEDGVYALAQQDSTNGGAPADDNEQPYSDYGAEDSTNNGAGAESYAQAKDSTLNGSGTVADNSAQAKDSTLNSYGTGADNSAQAVDSTLNGNNNTQAESSIRNGNNSTQADNSTRKSESCDRETLIERYGIDNVLDYEERFRKWSEKRGRQGMPLYPTISAWMKQDNVVNRREYSSIPDYYLSDDFLLEGF